MRQCDEFLDLEFLTRRTASAKEAHDAYDAWIAFGCDDSDLAESEE
jgi:hypothetical protein